MREEPDLSGAMKGSAVLPGSPATKTYQAGTLVYTKAALVILFFWLIWGDFCYTVMEAVTGPIMQLKFQKLGASNVEMGVILGTVPGILYSLLNPIISLKSDRFRSRWGRRIPFILFSIPFLVFLLIGLGYGEEMGGWLYPRLGYVAKGIPVNQVIILVLGALLVAFTFFNTFVTSTFWYLFNDVVPEQLLARFMSLFRIVGLLSSAVYSKFIFPYSGTHSTEIFLSAALLYLVGFGVMCLNVKEGKYPPPPAYIDGQTGPIAALKTYGLETHADRHYWYLWLATFLGSVGVGSATFTLFFYTSWIGLSLTQIGNLDSIVSIEIGVLTLGAAWLADRFHPLRVVVVACFLALFISHPSGLIWLFWHPAPAVAFWVVLALRAGIAAPIAALTGMWDPAMLMRLFPRSRYGQFCSMHAVWRSIGGIIGGAFAGAYLDVVAHWVGKDRAYSFLPVWGTIFSIPGTILMLHLYRSWKTHGGDENYVAPVLAAIETTPGMKDVAVGMGRYEINPVEEAPEIPKA